MKITPILPENLSYFAPFLLPEVKTVLEKDLPCTAIGLISDTTACGALAGYVDGDCFYICSLFIAPDYRRQGGGRLLLDTLQNVLQADKQIFTTELHYTVTNEDHALLPGFLEHLGFEEQGRAETIYGTTLGALKQSKFFTQRLTLGLPQNTVSLTDIPELYIKQYDRKVAEAGIRPWDLPLEQAPLDKELSLACLNNGQINACLLFDYSFDGRLTLLYADAGGVPELFPAMLQASFSKAMELYPPETKIVINAATAASAALVGKIIPADQIELLSHTAALPLRDDLRNPLS